MGWAGRQHTVGVPALLALCIGLVACVIESDGPEADENSAAGVEEPALGADALSSVTASAPNFTTYDLVVPVAPTSATTTVDGTGRLMPANRSYIIGVEGGLRGPLVFTNWNATNPNYPIMIVNKHGTGRVVISDAGGSYRDGIQIRNSSHVKLLGDNDPDHRYGFEVAQAGQVPSEGVARVSRLGVGIGETSTNVEVAFVEIHHTGFAGIMAKTDPHELRPETWAANLTMYDVSIHDCYIHDVGGEGMYIGYNSWDRDHWAEPPGFEGHEIFGLQVYNNLIERTMWDGFQYAATPDETAAIYNNVIIHSGTDDHSGQTNGLQVGSGASGKVYDNIIIDSVGNNIAMFGRGYNAVYNNLLIEGDNGIFADNRPAPPPSDPNARQTIPGSYYSFYNNTIINPARHAFSTMSEVTVTSFKNNVSLVPNLNFTDVATNGTTVHVAGNLLLRTTAGASFVNPAANDYRIQTGSSAANIGVSLAGAEVPVVKDFQGIARPQGPAYDAGFSEAGPVSVYLIATPPPAGGGTGSINASTIGGTPPYTYAWSNGATTATISGVPAGLYSVTVTDSAGAQMTRATYLIAGAEMGAPVTVTPPNQVLAPTLSPPGGTYTTGQTVTLSSPTVGDTIRYTTDGTMPTPSHGTIYSGPLAIGATTTLRAIAYKTGMDSSTVTSGTYVIDNGPPNTKFTIPGSAVTASLTSAGNVPANTVDGNLATYWGGHVDGAWIQYDLGSSVRVGFLNLGFHSGSNRTYTFDLLASSDGTTWTTILSRALSSRTNALQKYDIPDIDPVRYIRIVGHGSTYSPTINSYTEVEIWGGPAGGEPAFFDQDFSSSTSYQDYVAPALTPNLFSDISAEVDAQPWSIEGGKLKQVRTTTATTSNAAGFTRLSGPVASAPDVMELSFQVSLSGVSGNQEIAVLDIGTMTTLQDYSNSTPSVAVANRLAFRAAGTGQYKLVLHTTDTPLYPADGSELAIAWMMNQSGAARTYRGPDGLQHTVDSGASDLWIDGTKVLANIARNSTWTGTKLGGFRFRTAAIIPVTYKFDDFLLYASLPQ